MGYGPRPCTPSSRQHCGESGQLIPRLLKTRLCGITSSRAHHVKPGARAIIAKCVDRAEADRWLAEFKAEIEADIADAEVDMASKGARFDWDRGGIDMGDGVFIPTLRVAIVPITDLEDDADPE